MRVKQDSLLDIFQPGFNPNIPNHWNVTEKLETDSSFVYSYTAENVHSLIGDTIYFGKPNEGNWYNRNLRITGLGKKVETVGNLKNSTWYKFSNLWDRRFYVYVYVDSTGKVYRFDQDLSDY